MQWLIWLVVLLAAALGGELFHICRQRRELDRLSKSVEHFCCIRRTVLKKH